jgi:hypothetical protein
MRRILVTLTAVGTFALLYGSNIAAAAAIPSPVGGLTDSAKADVPLFTPARHVRGGFRGGFGGFRGGFYGGPFFYGAPYYYGDPYYYGNRPRCWYSRRYHHWVCPRYY